MSDQGPSHTENLIRQFREFEQTGTRTVDCPECGTEQAVRTEIDNDYGICGACGKRVKVGRII